MIEGGGRVGVGQQLRQEDLFQQMITSKMLTNSYIGVQVWLITSRQTVPELNHSKFTHSRYWGGRFYWENQPRDSCKGIRRAGRDWCSICPFRKACWLVLRGRRGTFEGDLVGRWLFGLDDLVVGGTKLEDVLFASAERERFICWHVFVIIIMLHRLDVLEFTQPFANVIDFWPLVEELAEIENFLALFEYCRWSQEAITFISFYLN